MIYSAREISFNKLKVAIENIIEQEKERLQIRIKAQVVLERWENKRPNTIMKKEIQEAVNYGGIHYIVSGPKSTYGSSMCFTIWGNNTHNNDPEAIKKIGGFSHIESRNAVQMFIGYLDGRKLTPITTEKVEENAKVKERLQESIVSLSNLLNQAPESVGSLFLSVRRWNEAVRTLKAIHFGMEHYSLSHLFEVEYNRQYPIWKD